MICFLVKQSIPDGDSTHTFIEAGCSVSMHELVFCWSPVIKFCSCRLGSSPEHISAPRILVDESIPLYGGEGCWPWCRCLRVDLLEGCPCLPRRRMIDDKPRDFLWRLFPISSYSSSRSFSFESGHNSESIPITTAPTSLGSTFTSDDRLQD